MKRLIHVWSESADWPFPDPLYEDGHTLGVHHGGATADTLQQAADLVFYRGNDIIVDAWFDRNYDREQMTFWGCPLFEREPKYV